MVIPKLRNNHANENCWAADGKFILVITTFIDAALLRSSILF